MGFPDRYNPGEAERHWQATWASAQTYSFDPHDPRPIFAIDTPPPTVSGEIHIGHVYSYVQAEAIARFQRMQGQRIYYPFGFDDNGLPTERYVERARKIRARDIGRASFIATCLEVSGEVEDRFEAFWKSLGMSVDWRLRYSTIDPHARRISQWSFIDLHRKGRIYREQAPNPWCVECQTAIAQAELDDAERETTFYTLRFALAEPGASPAIEIATTRPELLPACVAVFVHPDDPRYAGLIGGMAVVPLAGRQVPILADRAADPQKGTGAVMCCTFCDAADVAWWKAHDLPLIPLVTRGGALSEHGGAYAGLALREARARILADLREAGALAGERQTTQTVRIHERCKTPIEILETRQWFVRVLDLKDELIAAGRQIEWRPAHMRTRYEHWVQNLSWDWCISRQRFYGVPFPAWHCERCGAVVLADQERLPVDPGVDAPPQHSCPGSDSPGAALLRPDEDVMDTWATSSVSPLIATHFLETSDLRLEAGAAGEASPATRSQPHAPSPALLPMQLRPQAHDIIRTWAFDTIVKSHLHFGRIPWETIMISGHALAPDGTSIHKSLGNSPIAPATLISRYGADAVRYWACGGSLGSDQPVSEDEMRQGTRLCAKLWSAARFLAGFLGDGGWAIDDQSQSPEERGALPTDRALRSWTHQTIMRVTEHYRRYEYAAAREATERFFWDTLCDTALEWAKGRLYDGTPAERRAALEALGAALLATLKLLAPIMPHITEEIYQRLFAAPEGQLQSIHTSAWPALEQERIDPAAEQAGAAVAAIGAAARRFKTAQRLGMGTRLGGLAIVAENAALRALLEQSAPDIRSITRAEALDIGAEGEGEEIAPGLRVAIVR
jgi:valyl-tRNA synthetase